jgi:hypothetical protein
MTGASNEHDAEHAPHRHARRRPLPATRIRTVAPLLALVVLVVGCGGSRSPGHQPSASGASSSQLMARSLAYARCMRNHGVGDFPDPTASPGGGVTFQFNGGPGSDLDRNSPTFQKADQTCRSLSPVGQPDQPVSAQKMAAEVRWARCLRSHGVAGFPDPNAEGAFDSSRFNDSSPAFQTANRACSSQAPPGPISAVPGHGP